MKDNGGPAFPITVSLMERKPYNGGDLYSAVQRLEKAGVKL